MGNPVVEPEAPLKVAKLYAVYADSFGVGIGPHDCDDLFIGSIICCRNGIAIDVWYRNDNECNTDPPTHIEICVDTGFAAQRIISIFGPYDSTPECEAAHGL